VAGGGSTGYVSAGAPATSVRLGNNIELAFSSGTSTLYVGHEFNGEEGQWGFGYHAINVSAGTISTFAGVPLDGPAPLCVEYETVPTITAGNGGSQAAAIPARASSAVFASPSIANATLSFITTSSTASATVTPVSVNPAPISATPFTITGSTKIVDIQVTGITGSVTVCLDGASTDHLYHYTGTPAAWVELGSRSYANGQVCGVTTSFSPFAAAAPAALVAAPVAVPVPDPVQQSKITALSSSTAIAGTPTPVEITGSFVEKIRAIQINGVALAVGSWTQTATSVAFTMPAKAAGTYQIQLFNGSAPVLKVQNFTFTSPIVVVAPTPAPTAKPKVTYIRCAKPGHGTRVAYGVNPTCPAGYVKK
jgi:hypothetical protein